MIKLFRRIRQRLLTENRFSKYLLYAVGEIVLVVIGILIALQVNNWNNSNRQKLIEREILSGIREDIVNDTTDISRAIGFYEGHIERATAILDELTTGELLDNEMIADLYSLTVHDLILVLHTSHFKEAEYQGLHIIGNKELRKKLIRLYNYIYPALSSMDNDYKNFNSSAFLFPVFSELFEIDSMSLSEGQVIVSDEVRAMISSDRNIHYKIFEGREMLHGLVNYHKMWFDDIIEVIGLIDEEMDASN